MTNAEKKSKISELLAELKELQATPKSDWHMGFEALLRMETYKYADKVHISTEEEIGVMPPRADFVVLFKDGQVDLGKDIYDIFRKINIIEYKNPRDSLNERVLRKVCGYANLYIGVAEREDERPSNQVTISIFRNKKNPRMFAGMKKKGTLVVSDTAGIYYVKGYTDLPFQIVIGSELKGEEYAAYRALTDKADEKDIKKVVRAVVKEYYRTLINLIAEKNPQFMDVLKEGKAMRDVLMEIVKEDVNAKVESAVQSATQSATQKTTVDHIKDIMNKLKYSVEQAMDLLSIPMDERKTYSGLIKGSK